ncbi:MAG: phosphoethanolamine transferase [Muribaculaceae bacterium]|nr:phosphoethanolamine transferase [Muribaculaceae bacterium]
MMFLWFCLAFGVGLSPYDNDFCRPVRLELGFAIGLFPAVATAALASLTRSHARRLLIALCVMAWILFAIDSIITYFSSSRINEAVLRIILQSDPGEAGEFLAHLPLRHSLITLLPWLAAPFGGLIIGLGLRHIYSRFNHPLRRIATGIAIFGVSISAAAFTYFTYRGFTDTDTMTSGRITPLQFYVAYRSLGDNSAHVGMLKGAIDCTEASAADSTATTVVVVIGESDNRAHSSLYGYELDTWPRLNSIYRNQSDSSAMLVPFTDAVTGDGWTMYAMRHLLTVSSDSSAWSEQALWPALIRKAGLHLEYYDNQSTQATTASNDNCCLFFINDRDISDSCFDFRNDSIYQYDGELLDRYLPQAQATPPHSVLLFHLDGQHVYPDGRYPADKALFTAADYGFRSDLSEQEKADVAHYDNATAYLDENLARIIEAFEGRDAVVIYTPDHGELIYDYDHKFGRELGAPSPGYAKAIHQIPFVVYMTKSFIDKHPAKAEAIIANSRKRILSYDIAHLILDLAGVSSPALSLRRSVASNCYAEPTSRLIDDERYDFDSLLTSEFELQR